MAAEACEPTAARRGGATRSSVLRAGGLAILDHAAFAFAHFAANVVLARWLTPTDYGTLTLAYSTFLLGMAVHSALLSEPLLVFGRQGFAARFAGYWGATLVGHVVLSALIGSVFLVGAGALSALGADRLDVALAAVAGATPLLLLPSLMRRLCYVSGSPGVAAAGGAVHGAVLLGALVVLVESGRLSVATSIAAFAVASGASSAWIGARLRAARQLTLGRELLREAARCHWDYGRWAMLAILAAWIPWNLHYLILSRALDPVELAGIRVLYNVLLPVMHAMMALCAGMLPTLAAQLAGDPSQARRTASRLALVFFGISASYAVGILFFGPRILLALYGDAYATVYPMAPYVAAIQVPFGGIMILALVQRARGSSRQALLTNLPYVLCSLALGAWGGWQHGVPGFVFGLLASSLLAFLFSALRFRRGAWQEARSA